MFNGLSHLAIPTLMVLLLAATALPVAAGPSQEAPAVVVQAAVERDVNPPAEYVGRVEAVQAVNLEARVEGFLEEVRFREGSNVDAGDLLYVIEQAPYQAQVDADRAGVAKAAAALKQKRQYLKRLKSVRTGGISENDLETAESDMAQAAAELQEAQAALQLSELDLEYTTIEAPIAGRIGKTAFTRGNLVNPSSGTLSRIVQLDPIRVVYSVSETQLPNLRDSRSEGTGGDSEQRRVVRIRLPNGKMLESEGRIEFVDNVVDTTTGTIAVRALLSNPDSSLLPGQYVTVLVSWSEPERKVVIPQEAIIRDREGNYVLTVDQENRVVQRRIEIGATLETMIAVESGLRAGELVIVQGIQKVQPGQVVRPVSGEAS